MSPYVTRCVSAVSFSEFVWLSLIIVVDALRAVPGELYVGPCGVGSGDLSPKLCAAKAEGQPPVVDHSAA